MLLPISNFQIIFQQIKGEVILYFVDEEAITNLYLVGYFSEVFCVGRVGVEGINIYLE